MFVPLSSTVYNPIVVDNPSYQLSSLVIPRGPLGHYKTKN